MTPYQAAMRAFNNVLTPGMREYDHAGSKYLAETVPFAKRFLGSERISMRTGQPVVHGGYSVLNQLTPFSPEDA